jgi:hypothetical protein
MPPIVVFIEVLPNDLPASRPSYQGIRHSPDAIETKDSVFQVPVGAEGKMVNLRAAESKVFLDLMH